MHLLLRRIKFPKHRISRNIFRNIFRNNSRNNFPKNKCASASVCRMRRRFIEVTETLSDLVADVACVDVGEDEGIGMTCSLPAGNLGLSNTRGNSCVELDLAVDRNFREFLFCLLSGIVYLGDIGILCGAVGGEGKECDLGIYAEHLRALNGLAADLDQLRSRKDGPG